ncbi:hypothetical protein J7L09_02370 [bacterium]|nr:hypothetical protein [bacterium]
MKVKNKNKITILCFAVLNIFLLWYGFSYGVNGLKESMKELVEDQKELETIQATIASFQDFEKNYGEYKAKLITMEELIGNNLFIDKEIPSNLVSALEEWAAELGIDINISSTKIRPDEEDFWDFVGFKVSLTSQNVTPLLQFLEKLENSQWLIRISSVNISVQEKEGKIIEDIFIKAYVK